MKLQIVAVAAFALIASAPMALAGPGKSGAPGQMMHRYGSMGSPGASYWAHHKKRSHLTIRRSTTGMAVRHHRRHRH